MARDGRRRNSPGREYGSRSSQRPYSDEQETYRNPREDYRSSQRDDDDLDRDAPDLSHYGDAEYRAARRNRDSGEPDRDSGAWLGYEDEEASYGGEGREPFRRQGRARDSWLEPREENFSDARTRWPRDDKYRSEPRSQNWPHSRSGGREPEHRYFEDDTRQASVYRDRRREHSQHHQGGDREEPQWREETGYGQQAGSAHGHGNREMHEEYTGLGPKNYSRSDQRIREDVCDELSNDRACNAENVEVDVTDGIVNLSGAVPSRQMKHRAEDIAEAIRGVKDVENRIRVAKPEQAGSRGAGSQEHGNGSGRRSGGEPGQTH